MDDAWQLRDVEGHMHAITTRDFHSVNGICCGRGRFKGQIWTESEPGVLVVEKREPICSKPFAWRQQDIAASNADKIPGVRDAVGPLLTLHNWFREHWPEDAYPFLDINLDNPKASLVAAEALVLYHNEMLRPFEEAGLHPFT